MTSRTIINSSKPSIASSSTTNPSTTCPICNKPLDRTVTNVIKNEALSTEIVIDYSDDLQAIDKELERWHIDEQGDDGTEWVTRLDLCDCGRSEYMTVYEYMIRMVDCMSGLTNIVNHPYKVQHFLTDYFDLLRRLTNHLTRNQLTGESAFMLTVPICNQVLSELSHAATNLATPLAQYFVAEKSPNRQHPVWRSLMAAQDDLYEALSNRVADQLLIDERSPDNIKLPVMLRPPNQLISSDSWSPEMRRFQHPTNFVKKMPSPRHLTQFELSQRCAFCLEKPEKLYKCSACKRYQYCDRECQLADRAAHKNWCRKQK